MACLGVGLRSPSASAWFFKIFVLLLHIFIMVDAIKQVKHCASACYVCTVRYCFTMQFYQILSDCPMPVVCLCTSSRHVFDGLVGHHYSFAKPHRCYKKNSMRSPLAVGKFCDFQPKSPFISETVRDRPTLRLTSRSIHVGSNDLQ